MKKSSKALIHAREQIESRNEVFLCNALRDTGGRHAAVFDAIQESLKPWGTVDDWLNSQWIYRSKTPHYSNPEYREIMRSYRLRWIDWMIEGYEKIGD